MKAIRQIPKRDLCLGVLTMVSLAAAPFSVEPALAQSAVKSELSRKCAGRGEGFVPVAGGSGGCMRIGGHVRVSIPKQTSEFPGIAAMPDGLRPAAAQFPDTRGVFGSQNGFFTR